MELQISYAFSVHMEHLPHVDPIVDHKESHSGIQTEINCKEDNRKSTTAWKIKHYIFK